MLLFFTPVIDPCQTDNGNCAENQLCIFEGPGMVYAIILLFLSIVVI